MGTTKKWSLKADDLKIVLNRIVGNRSYDLFSIKDDLKVIAKYISLIEQEDPMDDARISVDIFAMQ